PAAEAKPSAAVNAPAAMTVRRSPRWIGKSRDMEGLLGWTRAGRAAASAFTIGQGVEERKYRVAHESIAAGYPPASCLAADARGDRRDDGRRHLELGVTIDDAVAPFDPFEVGIDRPHAAQLILNDQQPHRPIQAGIRIRRHELGSQGRIAE